MPPSTAWNLRNLLSPVIARLLIYGMNSMDMDRVLSRIENKPILNAKALEQRWIAEWETEAMVWQQRAEIASAQGHRSTAHTCMFHATCARLARFLVNTSDIATKTQVYLDFSNTYASYKALGTSKVSRILVPCPGTPGLAAHLHIPANAKTPTAVVIIYSGLGSCKEEMNTLAQGFIDRGIAALVPDMPGSGETLFTYKQPCSMQAVEVATRALADYAMQQDSLDHARIGVAGLCMGGGYAFRAAALDPRMRWCATLFPLFINSVDRAATPQWMRSGPWYDFQAGGVEAETFVESMGVAPSDHPECPFFMAHGKYDNWMTLDAAKALMAQVRNLRRDLLEIADEPLLTGGNATTHAMPVGEQMHWVVPVIADWVQDRVKELEAS